MRGLLISMLISGFVLIGVKTSATTELQTEQVTGTHTTFRGEVTEIQGNTVELKNEIGKTNSFKVTDPATLKELKLQPYGTTIFKWVDENGVIQMTNDKDAVPTKYHEQLGIK